MTKKENCITDVHAFMENYKSGFNNIKGENELFKYYDFEREIVNLINNNRFSIILKGRQVHMSTILAAYTAWRMLNGKTMCYYSTKMDYCKHFVTKVRMMLIKYDDDANIEFKIDNRDCIKLMGLGSLKAISTPTAHRGWTFDEIIYDEAAFIDRFEEAISIGLPSLATGGKAIIASTSNGYGGFYKMWESSIKGENDFIRHQITYKDMPNRDEKWVEEMKRLMNYDERLISQELYAEFVTPIPIPKKKNNKKKLIQFRLNDELFNKLSMKLIEADVSISTYMRNLIIKDVNK
jgi:hypothetical protein